jgi:hypothetical protein
MNTAVVVSQHLTDRGLAMTKQIKIRVVRREPLDAEKLAAALVELAIHITKQKGKATPKPSQDSR